MIIKSVNCPSVCALRPDMYVFRYVWTMMTTHHRFQYVLDCNPVV